MRENLGGVVRFTMMKDRSSISVQEGDKRIPWQGAGGVNQRGILRLRVDFALGREVRSSLRMTMCF